MTLRGGAVERHPSRADSQHLGTIIISVLLVAVVWIVFGQTLGHEFVNYDDDQYVYDNPRITNGLSLERIGWAFTHVHADNWHPLTTISHMLDCQLYGLQPWGHHLTNVLLHTAAAIFLFLALWRLTGARWPSAFVGAVFAIHPLRVGSVAWVAERKDVLSGVFFMLTLWAYARYVRSKRPASGRYTTVLVFFALGLMCKPTLVALPFVLLLVDYWPLRRFAIPLLGSKSRSTLNQVAVRSAEDRSVGGQLPTQSIQYLLIEKIPFLALSAASCLATLLAQGNTVVPIRQLTFGNRVGNAMVSYVAYIGQMIWPAGLSVFYPHPERGLTIAQVLLASLALLMVSVIFFIWRGKYPFLWIGWLWFLGMLVPMIGLVQVGEQVRADRYTYLPQIGLSFLVTWGAMELFAKWRRGREVLIAIAVLIITGLMADSYIQTSYWRNAETLWNQALANTSGNYVAHNGLGDVLMKKGQVDEAVVHFKKALEIFPDSPVAHVNLGNVLLHNGNWAGAITSYEAAIRVKPNYPSAHNNMGISLMKLGKSDEALAQFREALRIDRDFQKAHRNLVTVLLRLGRRDGAVTHLRELLRLNPDDANVKAQLGQLGVEQ